MKQLNTAVKVTDKQGKITTYNSLEEASEATGLSIQALKIRANKNSVPKDKICVEWVDEHTKRSYLAKQSKTKGNRLELDIIKKLNDLGYSVCSSRSQSKNLDNNKVDIFDLNGNLPILIQAKCTQNTPNYFGIEGDCPIKDKPFTIIWKKQEKDLQSPGTIAMVPVEILWDYLKLKLQK